MKIKTLHKICSLFFSFFIFLLIFNVVATAQEFVPDDSQRSLSDSSASAVEINIVSPQVILQGKEMQMEFETSVSGVTVPVKWSSSNSDVISCTEDGKIKGLIKGKATITVKSRNGKSSDSITVYCAKKFEEPETAVIRLPFYLIHKTPAFFNIEKLRFNLGMISPFMSGAKVNVLGYYDDYFYVEYKDSGQDCKGFMWSVFFYNNVGATEIFRQISLSSVVLRSGESNLQKLTTEYKGTVNWTVSDTKIASFDKNNGKITAKSPGFAIITAQVGTTKKSCIVYSVSQWLESETATATKDITIRKTPSVTGETAGTVLKGTTMIADGDLENGMDWVYITSGDIKGFVHLDNFPGINYLMTEHHYYDQGFEERFGSGYEKIRDYSSVLNDVMMRFFGLKINQYIEPYTSLADECKIKTYGYVYKNNLRASCPKTDGHVSTSCLFDYSQINELIKDKGKGTDVIGHCLWTGQYLENNPRSSATPAYNTILFTVRRFIEYNPQTGSFYNKSNSELRNNALYLITHETAHLLGAVDGYCERDIENGHCSNENCYECNGFPIPDCIMTYNESSPENRTSVFCEDCIEIINEHLSNHH